MPPRVLLVEDDEAINEILHYNLTRAGYAVEQAWNGREALEAARREKPDAVLLDLMLPEVDGWEVCRQMAETPELKDVPVIIFTARDALEDVARARQFPNLAGYFTKPWATADVVRHVEKVVGTPTAAGGP